MSDIIERLQSATVGSRELDFWLSYEAGELDDVLPLRPSKVEGGDREFVVYGPDGKRYGWVGYHCVDPVTQSVDAALTLARRVAPGWEIALSERRPRQGESCSVWWHGSLFRIRTGGVVTTTSGGGTVSIKASTPALALCAAILQVVQPTTQAKGGGETP